MDPEQPSAPFRSDGAGFVRHYAQFGLESIIESAQCALDGVTLATFAYRSKQASGVTPDAWTFALGTKPHETEAVYGGRKVARKRLPTNTMCVYTPDTDWSVEFKFTGVLPVRLITVSKQKISSLLPEEYKSNFCVEPVSNTPFMSYTLSSMYNSVFDDANCDFSMGPMYTETMLSAIALELLRLSENSNDNVRTARKSDLPHGFMKKLDEFIAENAHDTITTQMLADLCGMPYSAFSEAIKISTGMTPYQLVISKRIERAQQLIATTQMPLSQVAYECGFSSQSHMSDLFRSKTKNTPSFYRN